MNNHLVIKTFGQTALLLDGKPVEKFRSKKATALLIYLACTQQAQNREVLADLLWDASSTKQALSNLRTVLAMLRTQLQEFVHVEDNTLCLANHDYLTVDCVKLREEISAIPAALNMASAQRLQTALNVYKGQFLQSFELQNAPRFSEWAHTKRYCAHNHVSTAFQKLTAFYLNTGNHIDGIDVANSWLQLDPVNEAAHKQLIELLRRSGQRSAALAQYEVCREVLWKELEVVPSAELQALQLTLQT